MSGIFSQNIFQVLPEVYGCMIFVFVFLAFGILFTQMQKNNPNVKNPSMVAGYCLGVIGSIMIISLVIL